MLPVVLPLLVLPSSVLVEMTGADSYTVREAATVLLSSSLEHASAVMVGVRSRDLEVRRRCERAAEALWRAHVATAAREVDAAWPTIDAFPFIDSLWWDSRRRRYDPDMNFLARLAHDAWHRYPHEESAPPGTADVKFPTYRMATRRVCVEARAMGVPMGVLSRVLAVMRGRDAVYLSQPGTVAATDH